MGKGWGEESQDAPGERCWGSCVCLKKGSFASLHQIKLNNATQCWMKAEHAWPLIYRHNTDELVQHPSLISNIFVRMSEDNRKEFLG